MNQFNLKCETGMDDFLDLIWYYVNNSQDEEIIHHRIGLQSSFILQAFIASFLEEQEDDLRKYAIGHFGDYFSVDSE